MSEAATAAPNPPPQSPRATAQPQRLHGLPPVLGRQTVVLVLGSFPRRCVAGRRAVLRASAQPVLADSCAPVAATAIAGPGDYAARCAWLLARGLGLWDVYADCERSGSLDSQIRKARVNDFAALPGLCPRLAALAHNGAASFGHSATVLNALRAGPGEQGHGQKAERAEQTGGAAQIVAARLPSTSPAHAAWSLERKLQAWGALMSAHGLL